VEDLIYFTITIAFFAICVSYVRGLDRLVRQSEDSEQIEAESDAAEVTR
jgi:hypothetical protein